MSVHYGCGSGLTSFRIPDADLAVKLNPDPDTNPDQQSLNPNPIRVRIYNIIFEDNFFTF
jgi:predicted component of type VI protein secretion system